MRAAVLERGETVKAEAYERVVRGHAQRLYRTALAVTGNSADAEEAVQDTFLRLWETSPKFASPEHEAAWLTRVTVNLCKNRLKSAWRRHTVPLTDTYPAADEPERELMEALARLPGPDRAVIHLFYYEGYSTPEIARLTGRRESSVRSRLTRARKKLKGLLEDED
ncbi:MAG: RNA polymerase sigma factor [Oscillospiraceae bacterium]|nr:RNA polymerase sigma factor [Oscillospiraceae bacterium]